MWILVCGHSSVSITVFHTRFVKRSAQTWCGDSKSHDFVDTTSFFVCSRHWHSLSIDVFHEASHRRWTQIQFLSCLARFIFLASDGFCNVHPVCARFCLQPFSNTFDHGRLFVYPPARTKRKMTRKLDKILQSLAVFLCGFLHLSKNRCDIPSGMSIMQRFKLQDQFSVS